ncbi:hypothetical protein RFI_18124, partial [Reticulomyxa filosa]
MIKSQYIRINFLFFGGFHYPDVSKSMHKYSIRGNKWMTFQNTLPSPLHSCAAISSEDNMYVHIVGGVDNREHSMSTHMKTEVSKWLSEEEMKKGIKLKVEEEKENKKNTMETIVNK